MKIHRLLLVTAALTFGCDAMDQVKTAQALAAVCEGQANSGAAAYTKGPGPHPISAVRYADGGKYREAGKVLTMGTEQPKSVAEAQLVLCIDAPTEQKLGVCVYDTVQKVAFVQVPGTRQEGPTYERTRVNQTLRVVEAATATVVATETLDGAQPPACDADLIGGPDEAYFRGGPPGDYTIGQWTEGFLSQG